MSGKLVRFREAVIEELRAFLPDMERIEGEVRLQPRRQYRSVDA